MTSGCSLRAMFALARPFFMLVLSSVRVDPPSISQSHRRIRHIRRTRLPWQSRRHVDDVGMIVLKGM